MLDAGLLFDAIIILINENTDRTRNLVTELLKLYDNIKNRETSERPLIEFYIALIKQLISEKVSKKNPDALKGVLLKLKSSDAYQQQRDLMLSIEDIFSSDKVLEKETIDTKIKSLFMVLEFQDLDKALRTQFALSNKAKDAVDDEERLRLMTDLKRSYEDLQVKLDKRAQESAENAQEQIDFHKKDTIVKALTTYTERKSGKGIIHMGLQGLNMALGKSEGFTRGESICFIAPAHSYKSSLLRSIACWAILYNDLKQIPGDDQNENEKKPPCIYFASIENESNEDMVWIFRKLYMEVTGTAPTEEYVKDPENHKEIYQWMVDYFEKERGVRFIMERHMPDKFSPYDYINRLEKIGKDYDIVLSVLDYLGKCSFPGNLQRDVSVKKAFSAVCNYTKNKGITFVTAHQTNRRAKEDTANKTNKVKLLDDRHLADSTDVLREVDCLIYQMIEENHVGEEYLTFMLRKHRYVDDTPASHKYFAQKFVTTGIEGLRDDFGKEKTFTRDIMDSDEASMATGGASMGSPLDDVF